MEINLVQRFLIKVLSFETLSQYKWYRKKHGGFWINDHRLGWNLRPIWLINNDLELYKTDPNLYAFGKDIEDYRDGNQKQTTNGFISR
jgi:hypothetical protein